MGSGILIGNKNGDLPEKNELTKLKAEDVGKRRITIIVYSTGVKCYVFHYMNVIKKVR